MAGLQGAGKTTSVGKLAKFLRERHKKKVLVVSADVYRPAAIKQLETLAQGVNVDFFPSECLLNTGKRPRAEQNRQIDAGIIWKRPNLHASVSVFGSDIK